jgi:hypothetical protein
MLFTLGWLAADVNVRLALHITNITKCLIGRQMCRTQTDEQNPHATFAETQNGHYNIVTGQIIEQHNSCH